MIDHEGIRARLRKRYEDLGLPMTGEWHLAYGIGKTTVRNFVQGMNGSITVETICKLAAPLKTSEEWLLLGDRQKEVSVEALTPIVRNALLEAQPGMTLSELAPVVASAIHDQLELAQSGAEVRDLFDAKAARGTAARSPAPTTQSVRESQRRT